MRLSWPVCCLKWLSEGIYSITPVQLVQVLWEVSASFCSLQPPTGNLLLPHQRKSLGFAAPPSQAVKNILCLHAGGANFCNYIPNCGIFCILLQCQNWLKETKQRKKVCRFLLTEKNTKMWSQRKGSKNSHHLKKEIFSIKKKLWFMNTSFYFKIFRDSNSRISSFCLLQRSTAAFSLDHSFVWLRKKNSIVLLPFQRQSILTENQI